MKFFYITIIGLLSITVSGYFVNGDQTKYRYLYENITENSDNFFSFILFTRSSIGSAEPIYSIFALLANYLSLSKDFFVLILNVAFITALMKISVKKKYGTHLLFFISISSVYTLQLLFELERLKLAYILLFTGVLFFDKNRKFSIFLFMLSVLTHVQILLLYFSYMIFIKFDSIIQLIKYLKFNKSNLSSFIILVISLFILYASLGSHIESKLLYYSDRGDSLNDLIKTLLLIIIFSIFISKDIILKYYLSFAPLIVAVYFLSADRITIMIYTLILFYMFGFPSRSEKLNNFGFILIILLFGFKGILSLGLSIEEGRWTYIW